MYRNRRDLVLKSCIGRALAVWAAVRIQWDFLAYYEYGLTYLAGELRSYSAVCLGVCWYVNMIICTSATYADGGAILLVVVAT